MNALLYAAPAIPLDEAGEYVAAAYIVFVVLLLIYVAIMAARLGTLSKEIESLAELAERRDEQPPAAAPPATTTAGTPESNTEVSDEARA